MRRMLVSVVLVLVSLPAVAANRAETLEALLDAQGIFDLWQRRLIIERAENEKLARQAMDQILARIEPDQEFTQQAQFAISSFLTKAQHPWTVQEIVAAWGKAYAKDFSDEELERLLDFYASGLGQKEVSASQAAYLSVSQLFQQKAEPVRQQALEELIMSLQEAAKDYRARVTETQTSP
jgi:hypothetical protein